MGDRWAPISVVWKQAGCELGTQERGCSWHLWKNFQLLELAQEKLCICGNGSPPLEDPLFRCQSDSWEQADDTKWVISAVLNTEVIYKVQAGGSGRQLRATAGSECYFPALSTLTNFLLVVWHLQWWNSHVTVHSFKFLESWLSSTWV